MTKKLSIGSLKGVSVRTRVRLATITELVKDGEVLGLGVATIHPGEEETFNAEEGARLSGRRALEDFFKSVDILHQERKHELTPVGRLLASDQFRKDQFNAEFQLGVIQRKKKRTPRH